MKLPEKIDLSSSEKYILAFEISNEMYSFSIYDTVEGESFFHHEIEKKIGEDAFSCFKDFYYENEFLAASYHKIFVVNNAVEFTFIPAIVFDEKKKDEFFRFNFSENEDKVLAQTLKNPEITILHNIPVNVFDFFNRTFVDLHFIHHLFPLISYFVGKTRMGNAHRLIVNMQKKGLDILYFAHSGELIFSNHFKCSQLNDAVYYIFFIWKQFHLNQLKDCIYVAGNSYQKQDLIMQLQKYVQNIFPVNITSSELLYFSLCEL